MARFMCIVPPFRNTPEIRLRYERATTDALLHHKLTCLAKASEKQTNYYPMCIRSSEPWLVR